MHATKNKIKIQFERQNNLKIKRTMYGAQTQFSKIIFFMKKLGFKNFRIWYMIIVEKLYTLEKCQFINIKEDIKPKIVRSGCITLYLKYHLPFCTLGRITFSTFNHTKHGFTLFQLTNHT